MYRGHFYASEIVTFLKSGGNSLSTHEEYIVNEISNANDANLGEFSLKLI